MSHKPPARVSLAYRTKDHAVEQWDDESAKFGAIKVEYVRADLADDAIDRVKRARGWLESFTITPEATHDELAREIVRLRVAILGHT